ncbi:MAG: hypothetical protein NE327_11960 [Lentisphaeraceae bacterium]|nr:hypothetical protein [Lentisphaeraceae bacterium]
MKKLLFIAVIALFFAGCSSSPYVGEWKSTSGDTLQINDDGTLKASWKESDGTTVDRDGQWEKADDGSIQLDGSNASAKARLVQDKLILETQRKVRVHFTRNQLR